MKNIKEATPHTLDLILTQSDKILALTAAKEDKDVYELYHQIGKVIAGTLGYNYQAAVLDKRVLDSIQQYVDDMGM